jgi:hypothetical protein
VLCWPCRGWEISAERSSLHNFYSVICTPEARFTRNNLLIVLSLIYFVLHIALNVMIFSLCAAMEQSHLFSLHYIEIILTQG